MRSFRNLSLRTKLLLAVIVTVVIALFIALAAIATLSHKLASKDFNEQLDILVDITAQRSQAALAFKDKRTVLKNIQTLSTLPSIELACMYDVDDTLFSQYERTEKAHCKQTLPTAEVRLNSKAAFYVAKQLIVKKRYIGTLYVEANADGVNQRLVKFLIYAGLIILFTSLITYWIAYQLQFSLTLPIIKLSDLAKKIGKTKDLSLRAKVYNEDEAGYLAKSFNGLMHDIQESQIETGELVLELQEKTQQLESHSEFVEGRNKSIKNMFAGASHDLKQPLQAMVLFVNALNSMSDPAQKDLLGKLEQAINNMRSLFESLLDVSKLESRLGEVEISQVAVKPIIANVFNEFEVLAEDKSLALKFHLRDFNVVSNAGMLERIVRNLVSNAIRYTNKGSVLLACRERNGFGSIEVWDTGIGIAEDSIDSIFERFHQVEQEDEANHQGHGLGLSIVKRLSERLEHTIEVESNYGRGTVFRILLPLSKQVKNIVTAPSTLSTQNSLPAETLPLYKHPVNQLSINQIPGNELNVLLIDDDSLLLDSLKVLMESWGMNVQAFSEISQLKGFLETNKNYQCDVIVSDFHLSDTETGLDAISLVRALLSENTPALIVSATESAHDIQKIKDSSISLLKKPVKAAKLRALINHVNKAN